MKKIKEFTLRKSNNCSGFLFDSTGNQCCVIGSFFRACGVPVEKMKNVEYSYDINREVEKLYSKELKNLETDIHDIIWDAIYINDNKKTNWVRRLKKLREIFKQIGVKIRFRD